LKPAATLIWSLLILVERLCFDRYKIDNTSGRIQSIMSSSRSGHLHTFNQANPPRFSKYDFRLGCVRISVNRSESFAVG